MLEKMATGLGFAAIAFIVAVVAIGILRNFNGAPESIHCECDKCKQCEACK